MKNFLKSALKAYWGRLAAGSFAFWTVLSMASYGFIGFGFWPWVGIEDPGRVIVLFIFFAASVAGFVAPFIVDAQKESENRWR